MSSRTLSSPRRLPSSAPLRRSVRSPPPLGPFSALIVSHSQRTKRPKAPISSATLPSSLLSTLAYDLSTHAPESADWLNVLLAQTLSAYRTLINASTEGEGGAKGLMESMLNRKSSPDAEDAAAPGLMGIDWIEVDEVLVGDKFPVLSNARVRPSGEGEGVVSGSLFLAGCRPCCSWRRVVPLG